MNLRVSPEAGPQGPAADLQRQLGIIGPSELRRHLKSEERARKGYLEVAPQDEDMQEKLRNVREKLRLLNEHFPPHFAPAKNETTSEAEQRAARIRTLGRQRNTAQRKLEERQAELATINARLSWLNPANWQSIWEDDMDYTIFASQIDEIDRRLDVLQAVETEAEEEQRLAA